jgi:hypothetical protein
VRTIVLLLIAANLILLGFNLEVFNPPGIDKPEPWHLGQDLSPQNMVLLQAAHGKNRKAMTACVELGGFGTDESRRVDGLIEQLGLTAKFEKRQTQDSASYMVYLRPYRSMAEAERALTSLRNIGVTDLYLITDNSPQRLGISLGLFKTEAAANAQMAALTQRGLRLLRVDRRDSTLIRTWYLVRNPSADTLAAIDTLQRLFPAQERNDCP